MPASATRMVVQSNTESRRSVRIEADEPDHASRRLVAIPVSGIEVGAEELGQCEAKHWGFGRCHYVPHPEGTDHWIEHPFGSGRGVTFTDETAKSCAGSVLICEDIHTPTTNGATR